MKKTTQLMLLTLSFLFILSCGESSDNGMDISEIDKVAEKTKDKNAKGSAEKWQDKYNELFTKEDAAKATGFDVGQVKEEMNNSIKSMQEVKYSWANGREWNFTTPSGTKINTVADDRIALRSVKNMSLKQFKAYYHNPTQEEMDNLDKALDDGDLSKSDAQLGKDLGSGLAGMLNYVEVPGVGEYCVWNAKTEGLFVYYKGTKFEITVNVSNDEAQNKETAIQAAKTVIAKL